MIIITENEKKKFRRIYNSGGYATPVAYGLLLIPAKYIGLYNLNPVTPAILSFRYGVFGEGYFDIVYYLVGWAVTLAIAFFGLILFNRIEKNFADTV